MRVAGSRLKMLDDRGAGAPVEAALVGALIAGAGALLASSSLANAGTKPLAKGIKAEAHSLAERPAVNDGAAEPADPGSSTGSLTAALPTHHQPAVTRANEASNRLADKSSRSDSQPSEHAVLRIALPKAERQAEAAAAEQSLLMADAAGPVLRMKLPTAIPVGETFALPSDDRSEPATAIYKRPEPALAPVEPPMIVVARIDLPPARPIEDDLPEQPIAASAQLALVEERAVGRIKLPVPTELSLTDDRAETSAPKLKPEPVLVASIDDIEKQLSFAAGFDLRSIHQQARDDVPAAGSIEVEKTVLANGRSLGKVPLRIASDATVSIRLGDLLELFRHQMNSRNFAALDASAKANTFVSFRRLRAAGIGVSYDPVRDSISMSLEG